MPRNVGLSLLIKRVFKLKREQDSEKMLRYNNICIEKRENS